MKAKILFLLLFVCSTAFAVEYRYEILVVASSTPTYPECNRVYRIKQEKDVFTPGGWRTVGVDLIEDTCTQVE